MVELIKDDDQDLWFVWHLMSQCSIKKKPDSCWEWRGKYSGGYGYYFHKGKKYSMHRLMYQLWYGQIPKGMVIRHMCHNPQCCNPNHLKVGTHQQNMDDMKKAGRQGTASKLTPAQKRKIKYSPLSQRQLAKIYKVSPTTIWRVRNNHK